MDVLSSLCFHGDSLWASEMALRLDVVGLLKMVNMTSVVILELPVATTIQIEMNSRKPSDFVNESVSFKASNLPCLSLLVLVSYLGKSCLVFYIYYYYFLNRGYCVSPDKELTVFISSRCACFDGIANTRI